MAAPHLVPSSPTPLTANEMLDVVEEALHSKTSEWLFFRELRVGTGRGKATLQRLDAFAFNSLPHHAMKRICYEVKCSRGDLLGELKRPLKRRVGMRYSNEFYFVVPGGMVDLHEIPSECGLLEVGMATAAEWQLLLQRQAGFFRYTPESQRYCLLSIPAPWRDTPGPTWQLTAAMLRHQQREYRERIEPPEQGRLELV